MGKSAWNPGGVVVLKRVGDRRLLLAALVLLFLVLGADETVTAISQRGDAARLRAAAQYVGGGSPTAKDSECYVWETETVSSVRNGRNGGTVLYTDAGALHVSFLAYQDWAGGLAAGTPVQLLVWEGNAQAVRDPEGQVPYSSDAAEHEASDHIELAVLAYAAVVLAGGVGPAVVWIEAPAQDKGQPVKQK